VLAPFQPGECPARKLQVIWEPTSVKRDSDSQALFTYVAQQLNRMNLAYLHVIEPRVQGTSRPVFAMVCR
jgi:hypothetical protein